MKTHRRTVHKWLRRLAVVVGAVVALAAVVFLIAQTPWAKRRMADALERALGKLTGSTVSVGSLRGTVPFSVSLANVRFTDEAGTWLRLDDLRVRWAPFALLRGRIRIHEVRSSAIELTRIPSFPERKPEPVRPWREMIPSLVIGEIAIDELTLGPALAGQETRLRLTGAVDAREPLTLATTTWRLERTDDPGAHAEVAAILRDEPATLSLHVDLHEPQGRLLADLLGLDSRGAVSASLHGEGPLTAWRGDLAATADDRGELGATFLVELRDEPLSLQHSNPRVHGTLRLDLRHEEQTAHATAAFALQDGLLSASGLAAEGVGGRVTGHVALDLSSGLLDGELDGTIADVGALSALLGEEINGSLTLHAKVDHAQGRQNVVVDAQVHGIDSRAGHVEDAILRSELSDIFGTLRATATAEATGYRLADVTAETLSLEAEGDLATFSLSAHARGEYEKPFELNADATIRPGDRFEVQRLEARYADVPLVLRHPATIVWEGAAYSISSIELDVGTGRLVVAGRLGSEELAASAQFDDVPLELFRGVGAPETAGTASGLVEAHGTAAAPSIRTEIVVENLRSLQPAYRDLAAAAASVNARFERGELSGTVSLSQANGQTALDARVRLPMTLSFAPLTLTLPSDGPVEATLSADADVDVLSALLLPARYEFDGQLNAQLEAGGTIEAPKLEGTVRLTNGRCADTATQTVVEDLAAHASFTLDDGVLRLADVTVSARGTELTGHGHLDLGDRPWELNLDEPFEATMAVRADLAEFARLLMPGDQRISGRVALALSGTGTLDAPRVSGSLRVEQATYTHDAFGTLVDALDAQTDFALSDGVLAFSQFSSKSPAGEVTGSLRIGVRAWPWQPTPDGLLEAKLAGTMRLDQFAALLLPEDQWLTGRIEADVEISGTGAEPVVSGWLRLRDGAYENVRTGTLLRDVAADIEPNRSRLTLKNFSATDGQKGTLTATGWLDIAPDEHFPFRVELSLGDAVLVRADYLTGAANGTITLAGSSEEMLLAGHITTGATEVQLPERAAPELAELNVIEINAPDGAAPAPMRSRPMRPVHLDLSLRLPKRVFVRGHGLDSEWEGRLRITGDSAEPVVTGRLTLVRGWFDFADRHFRLTDGSILFGGATPPAPILSIKAEAAADGITAIIELAGPVTAPVLTLSAVPVLPSDEVLARVLFGRSVTNLTPYQALRLAQIMDTLARGGNGFSLLGHMRRIMKVDRLELTEADETGEGAAVSAGRYLSDDLYVEVKKGVSGRTTTISIEKQVGRNLSVESDIGTHQSPGLGIKLRWDY